MVEPHFVDHGDPDEVFALLSNDRRVRILQTLWELERDTASFSELRDAVGMRDSGQFSYHLDELVGRFVAKTAEGYELTRPGIQITGAIDAGSYTMDGSIDPIDLEEPCPRCDGDRTLRYEDETVHVECADCPVGYVMGVPPAVFARHDREAIPRVASNYLRTIFHQLSRGFCPRCDGPTEPTVEPVPATALEGAGQDPDDTGSEPAAGPQSQSEGEAGQDVSLPWVRYTCRQCGAEPTVGLSMAFIDHPAVVRFYYDRGIDPTSRLVWDVADADPETETIRTREPFRASVTYEAAGDRLTVTVEEAGDVVEIEDGPRPG